MKKFNEILNEAPKRIRNIIPVSILPIGVVNFKTGKSKYFNVYETWEGDNTIVEIWKITDVKKVAIIGSGKKPMFKKGERKSFQHDQTLKPLWLATLVDFFLLQDLPKKGIKHGKSLSGYVYK